MASFGQRIGKKPIREVMQTDDLDEATRVRLWNLIHPVTENLRELTDRRGWTVMRDVWRSVLGRAVDEFSWPSCELQLKSRILRDDWVEAMEAMEGFAKILHDAVNERTAVEFRRRANLIFTEDLVGYRYIGSELAPVEDEQSANEVEAAIAAADDVARRHLQNAVSLLADRHNPQYAKVASEAILAVEASVHALTGKKTLGDGVKELGKVGLPVHPAIVKAWGAMYGYASDAGGMRHANIGGEEVDAAMAVYLLVTCSAFVNLLTKVAAASSES
ncbi:hypothetical protein MRBLWO14_000971 [Microbacterium sp. LWO14-1.2]|uniref:AbiJ-NTD4 domain-containing protein n=1 Tax=Microbacterium sp. LWO14-1.2 TaxID=3135263 RepID=UPI003138CF22